MFDFGNVNPKQREAIITTEGPVLISAGPGTGKTATLVNRFAYLVNGKKVSPKNIMVSTFTEKAAKEIITRISTVVNDFDLNEVYIGTFHSICLQMVRDNLEYIPKVRKNFILMDDFDQKYFIYQNLYREFQSLDNFKVLFEGNIGIWTKAEKLASWLNGLAEERVNPFDLINDINPAIVALGEAKIKYDELLERKNRLDFATIQATTLELLEKNPNVLKMYQELFQYMMIDEYQDTNSIQEKLIFKLSATQNICVVGDDDQSMYRFRGATIENILNFKNKFLGKAVSEIKLVTNYRSAPEIINFYNKWMSDYSASFFQWDKYRIEKNIIPSGTVSYKNKTSPVFKISGNSDEQWCERLLNFINDIMKNGQIADYNQIAFLFRSVKSPRVKLLLSYFEENGVAVYSPRSDMFFDREEVKIVIGLLLHLFPEYEENLFEEYPEWMKDLVRYYESCIELVYDLLDDDPELEEWLMYRQEELSKLKGNTDYAFTQLFYQMLSFDYFRNIVDIDLSSGISDQRAIRNFSILTNLLAKFEYNERVDVISSEKKIRTLDKLFKTYLRFLMKGGLDEYQDESEYAPSGCVSFLTIHQSKGMEFPIVITDSLYDRPENERGSILDDVYNTYTYRNDFEPTESIKFFDFWRRYYVAFSRAQDLLVLSTPIKESGSWPSPSASFAEAYDTLQDYYEDELSLDEFDFSSVKVSELKQSYAFTADISKYEACSLEYKMFRELGFSEIRVGATLFGSLVHQTIEDVHNAILRGEESTIENNLESWFEDNYIGLVESEHSYLAPNSKKAALQYVKNYIEDSHDQWSKIRETEVQLSYPMEGYILNGKIDLLQGEGDTVEIIDFKTDDKLADSQLELLNSYEKQLQVYAHLVEEKYGITVSKMKLYYPGNPNDPIIEFEKNDQKIGRVIAEFSDVVRKIQKYEYSTRSSDKKHCSNCDMRFYCGKANPRK
ncbi:ATP-dependent DNA helicase [Neobacillus sp. CF12]|uniref:ATP-dependent helicase n=1 Tax=Neobacillus sp. CF12 TaxID=3055864 RepID=UPI0025A04EB9|nr:ATP-dependent DNA helicase [Neobacillus sp. CF12]MDM5326811.1 ATP-dependent DNA helicase [Neobacillus sp. CF12]